jgi:hypothetical protein
MMIWMTKAHTAVVQGTRRNKERLTVSLSREARAFIQDAAAARGTDQSAVVEDAVRRMQREERRQLSREVLLAMAEQDEALAEAFTGSDEPIHGDPW